MRDKTHLDQIERSAEYVRKNPDKWKAKLKPFIDGQFIMAERFYKKLMETKEGREKLRLLGRLK